MRWCVVATNATIQQQTQHSSNQCNNSATNATIQQQTQHSSNQCNNSATNATIQQSMQQFSNQCNNSATNATIQQPMQQFSNQCNNSAINATIQQALRQTCWSNEQVRVEASSLSPVTSLWRHPIPRGEWFIIACCNQFMVFIASIYIIIIIIQLFM